MAPSEFTEKLTRCLLLCDGWLTSGPRPIKHNAVVGGVWDSLHQVGMGYDCKLDTPRMLVPIARQITINREGIIEKEFTYAELFVRMCSRLGLLAIDEGDHFHVQPRVP